MGVEPTTERKRPVSGFEDREHHRMLRTLTRICERTRGSSVRRRSPEVAAGRRVGGTKGDEAVSLHSIALARPHNTCFGYARRLSPRYGERTSEVQRERACWAPFDKSPDRIAVGRSIRPTPASAAPALGSWQELVGSTTRRGVAVTAARDPGRRAAHTMLVTRTSSSALIARAAMPRSIRSKIRTWTG
jgi:hypothetical protein